MHTRTPAEREYPEHNEGADEMYGSSAWIDFVLCLAAGSSLLMTLVAFASRSA